MVLDYCIVLFIFRPVQWWA